MLQSKNGILIDEKVEGMEMLKAVSWWWPEGNQGTLWSEIFNQVTGDLYIVFNRDNENIRKYHLKMSN